MGRLPGTRHNKLARHSLFSRISAKILAQRAIKRQLLAIVSTQGELFRARTHIRPSRATNTAHSTQKHGDIETNNTTAHPQQGTYETRITSAPTNCTKTAHFSPAKAMPVSTSPPHRPAKATMVSNHRADRARLRCPWAAAGPGRASSRHAERSSRRGRLAGGPPPTGASSSPARLHPQRHEAATGFPAAASSRSRSGAQHGAASDQAVMST